MTARLLVTGSRLLTADRHADAVRQGLVWAGTLLGRDTVLVHGDCPPRTWRRPGEPAVHVDGLDRIARDQWLRWGLADEPHPADWGRVGVRAGPKRNQAMVDTMDLSVPCLAMAWPYPDPAERSAGTWDCVRRALAASVPVLDGWTLLPITAVPDLPPTCGYTGPRPHRTAARA